MREGGLIDQASEGLCQLARDCGRSSGARAIQQALGPLLGKTLPPFAPGSIRHMEGRGDGGDVLTRAHRRDSVGTAKDTGLLGLLEQGFQGRERMSGKVAFEGAHRWAPWAACPVLSQVFIWDAFGV